MYSNLQKYRLFPLLWLLWACTGTGGGSSTKPLELPKAEYGLNIQGGLSIEVIPWEGLRDYLRGKSPGLRVVHLWATWCLPCLRELASWDRLRREYAGAKVDWLFVDLSKEADWKQEAADWLQKYPGIQPCYHVNPEQTEGKFDLLHPDWQGSLPTTLLLRGDQSLLLEKAMSIEELRQHFKSFGL